MVRFGLKYYFHCEKASEHNGEKEAVITEAITDKSHTMRKVLKFFI